MSGQQTPDAATPNYTMGYSEEFQKLLRRRNAATSAAHLLAHLKSGLRVLDLGCGPGTISIGLAQAIAPGELDGIDMEASQIQMARAAAAAGGHGNATFHTGDVTALPFDNDSFDVAHFHAVLMHVPDTRAVLAEALRVVKPGGIIAAREMIGDATFTAPEVDDLAGAMATFLKLLEANGGHPQMGKHLRHVLIEAGFSDVRASASFEFFSTTEDIHFYHEFAIGWFFSPPVVEAVTRHGLATRGQMDGWRRLLDRWRDSPGAFSTIGWGEAIGRKP